ncbi:hypothetical protein L2D01_09435 [Hyphomonadaceae bacterium ML37]|nr:hypothetical protein L2D01_09435 [Hyphomonadaceae bacterium ML37]
MAATRFAAALMLGALAIPPAQAQDDPPAPAYQALMACRSVEPEAERMACLDRELARFAAAVETGRVVVIEREAVRALERESFGIDMPGIQRLTGLLRRSGSQTSETDTETLEDGSQIVYRADGGVEEMRAMPVTRVTYDRVGMAMVTLANGQVWVQTDSTNFGRVTRSRIEDGLTADLYPGALGSHFMALSHHPRRFRARRLE